MKKDIKDYLHLYFGSAIADSSDGNFIVCESLDADFLKYLLDSERLKDFRLVLRPLSDMTEEEAVDIAIIMYGQPDSVRWRMEDKGNYFNVYRKHYSESFTIDKASGDIDRYSKEGDQMELQTTLQHHFITRYLLSKGFDLFGLIEAGLAIDKTKIAA